MLETSTDFCIEINFQKGTGNPSRVFRTMFELIEAFQALDEDLVKSIDAKIESVVTIEGIETGSIKALLKTMLRCADDEAIKKLDWKPAVGEFLIKAKYFILDFMEDKTGISSREQVAHLEMKLLGLAEQTDIKHLPSYAIIERQKLLSDMSKISSALSYLGRNDKALYRTHDSGIAINSKFNIIPEHIEELLTRETIKSTTERILKVKKPDYLGESKWDFQHETRVISAKILDIEWLERFQAREYDVRPGDSIRATVEEHVKYGYDNEVVGINYNIIKVQEIIPYNPPIQMSFI